MLMRTQTYESHLQKPTFRQLHESSSSEMKSNMLDGCGEMCQRNDPRVFETVELADMRRWGWRQISEVEMETGERGKGQSTCSPRPSRQCFISPVRLQLGQR